jgi:hypothetical protein
VFLGPTALLPLPPALPRAPHSLAVYLLRAVSLARALSLFPPSPTIHTPSLVACLVHTIILARPPSLWYSQRTLTCSYIPPSRSTPPIRDLTCLSRRPYAHTWCISTACLSPVLRSQDSRTLRVHQTASPCCDLVSQPLTTLSCACWAGIFYFCCDTISAPNPQLLNPHLHSFKLWPIYHGGVILL